MSRQLDARAMEAGCVPEGCRPLWREDGHFRVDEPPLSCFDVHFDVDSESNLRCG